MFNFHIFKISDDYGVDGGSTTFSNMIISAVDHSEKKIDQ